MDTWVEMVSSAFQDRVKPLLKLVKIIKVSGSF